jgi:hypothetical protein
MTQSKPNMPAIVLSAVVLLGAVASVALVANFSEAHTFGALWPGVAAAVGLSLIFWGYLELGLGVLGVFLLWLLANLGVLPEFTKSWPFTLIWVLILVVVGYLRARSRIAGKSDA